MKLERGFDELQVVGRKVPNDVRKPVEIFQLEQMEARQKALRC